MANEITLALGGGGIRGIAHIGVVKALIRHGITVKSIAGTSAGGILGAVLAAGYSTIQIEEAAERFAENPDFKRKSSDLPSLLGINGIHNLLVEYLSDRLIEDLPIPLVTTAVSVRTGKEILINKGKVVDAVLATIAIPGILPSQDIGGKILMDGGVLDPVPVKAARWLNPTLPVVAVVLHKKPDDYEDSKTPLPIKLPLPTSITDQLSKLRLVEALSIFSKSAEVSSNRLSELTLIIDEPDVIIEPLVGHYNLLDKVHASDLIKAGEEAAEKAMPGLMKAFSSRASIKRIFRYGVSATENSKMMKDMEFFD